MQVHDVLPLSVVVTVLPTLTQLGTIRRKPQDFFKYLDCEINYVLDLLQRFGPHIRQIGVLFVESPHVDVVVLGGYPINMPVEEETIGALSVPGRGYASACGHILTR